MYILNDKFPLIKGKGFLANPISRNGLPEYADSRSNPNVIGTKAYTDFWEEQLYYIHNGYQTGGVFIPGRLYYFLNYGHVASVKGGSDYPNYVDLGLEYCELIMEAKRLRKNLIIPKARRKGLSVMTDIMVIDYGWRFSYNYQGGIIAGKKEYADDFIDKWLLQNKLIVPEFETTIKSHDTAKGEILAGYEERQLNNSFQTQGTANMIYYKTAGTTESVMKGKYLMDLVYEESGEFENLIETHNASKDCLMHGNIQYGTAYFYGTGGNMLKGSKDFKKIWNEPDAYNCIRFPVLAPRYFEPCVAGSKDETGKINEDIPNLLQYKEYQRIGMEDTKRAEELILEKRAELIKAHDKKPYHDYCQNNPLSVEEIFQNSSVNNFDPEILNKQSAIIDSELPSRRYGKYKLKYVTNDKGVLLRPLQVVAEPANQLDDEKECVLLLEAVPKKGYRNLYIGGCLLPGEKVMTDEGLMDVDLVTKNNKLVNEEGKLVEINELLRHDKINEEVFKLKVSNTFRTTTFTSEHPILVSRPMMKSDRKIDRLKLNFNYERVSEIKINDWIKVPNVYRNKNDFDISVFWDDMGIRVDRIAESPMYSPDFWWIIGLWLGDGWNDNDGYKIHFAINTTETEYFDRVIKIISTLFNRSVTYRQRGNCIEVSFCHQQLSKFLSDNFGKFAHGKKIPEWAKRINDDCKKQLVLGYLDSDGCISLDKKRNLYNTQFVSINLELLESFQDVLFSLGHVSQLCKLRSASMTPAFGRSYLSNIKECYQLRLGHSDTLNLTGDLWNDFNPKLRRIDFGNIKKTRARAADGCFLDESLDFIYFQIREIETDLYTGIVYNFNCETHTFMCHHITTHNCDSYDQDQARESKSLGAFVIIKQLHFIKGEDEMIPVAIIRNRPKRKEIFYENCMKLSIMFDLVENTMFDAAKPAVIQYYKDKGCERYLSPRPRKFESDNSSQTHDYGVLLTGYSRPRMESLLQSYFLDHTHKVWFPQILDEALSYDEGNNENDLDLIDALGCALIRMADMNYGVIDENNTDRDKMGQMPEWGLDGNGNLIDKTSNYIVDDSLPEDFKTIFRGQSNFD